MTQDFQTSRQFDDSLVGFESDAFSFSVMRKYTGILNPSSEFTASNGIAATDLPPSIGYFEKSQRANASDLYLASNRFRSALRPTLAVFRSISLIPTDFLCFYERFIPSGESEGLSFERSKPLVQISAFCSSRCFLLREVFNRAFSGVRRPTRRRILLISQGGRLSSRKHLAV
jgi:hypothetical protein